MNFACDQKKNKREKETDRTRSSVQPESYPRRRQQSKAASRAATRPATWFDTSMQLSILVSYDQSLPDGVGGHFTSQWQTGFINLSLSAVTMTSLELGAGSALRRTSVTWHNFLWVPQHQHNFTCFERQVLRPSEGEEVMTRLLFSGLNDHFRYVKSLVPFGTIACTTRVRKTKVRTTPVRSQQCECQQCERVNSAKRQECECQ